MNSLGQFVSSFHRLFHWIYFVFDIEYFFTNFIRGVYLTHYLRVDAPIFDSIIRHRNFKRMEIFFSYADHDKKIIKQYWKLNKKEKICITHRLSRNRMLEISL